MESINNLREMVKTAQSLRLKMADASLTGLSEQITDLRKTMPEYDASGFSWLPYLGGFASGAVKPHPNYSGLWSSMREGGAGLGGGLLGTLSGAGIATLAALVMRAKGLKLPAAAGAAIGAPLGTHSGAQGSRWNAPADMQDFALIGDALRSKQSGSIGNKTPAAELGRITGQK